MSNAVSATGIGLPDDHRTVERSLGAQEVLTSEQVRAQFEAEGLTLKEWAQARGYCLSTVCAVLSGRTSGRRGVTHKIAVDLGLKPMPTTDLMNQPSISDRRAQMMIGERRA